ncbi:hypothetical protein BJ875DRAFT_36350 [Amylocarpus encephaloides]|uniref:Uncharacterized protein n=1 Tax=Amylocarpus encephaloides TaxID=45428 RepID=A0A9P7YHT1_9HELO|nr:hypothetical protein BJ875DRAFT_36350 [Amylocarpus encephaloides]
MVQVFLNLYTCRFYHPQWDGAGDTGHGKAFLDIMAVLPTVAHDVWGLLTPVCSSEMTWHMSYMRPRSLYQMVGHLMHGDSSETFWNTICRPYKNRSRPAEMKRLPNPTKVVHLPHQIKYVVPSAINQEDQVQNPCVADRVVDRRITDRGRVQYLLQRKGWSHTLYSIIYRGKGVGAFQDMVDEFNDGGCCNEGLQMALDNVESRELR